MVSVILAFGDARQASWKSVRLADSGPIGGAGGAMPFHTSPLGVGKVGIDRKVTRFSKIMNGGNELKDAPGDIYSFVSASTRFGRVCNTM